MKKNMGNIDRVFRIFIVAVIGSLYFTKEIGGTLGTILLIIAVIFLITSLFRICPLYLPFGVKTFREKR